MYLTCLKKLPLGLLFKVRRIRSGRSIKQLFCHFESTLIIAKYHEETSN